MAFGVHISETAAAELAAMDEVTCELLLMEMIGLGSDPLGRGVELERDDAVSRRMLGVGALGLVVFEVDETAKRVTILDVIWVRPD
jgi:hypothetical protein